MNVSKYRTYMKNHTKYKLIILTVLNGIIYQRYRYDRNNVQVHLQLANFPKIIADLLNTNLE